jgi:type 1 glutamine amidotransferase
MNSKKTLIVYGGWSGHAPRQNAELFRDQLMDHDHDVTLSDSLSVFDDAESLKAYDLIIPMWTMGEPTELQMENLSAAVQSGVGLAGSHGGMGDAFRGQVEYEWMVGGHFVGHPHVGDYEVVVTAANDETVSGLPERFSYNSEQYYMLVDPVIEVLAETMYCYEGRECAMPVIWKKHWGQGRVFYSALGHLMQEFVDYPEVLKMNIKGLLWACK